MGSLYFTIGLGINNAQPCSNPPAKITTFISYIFVIFNFGIKVTHLI